MPRQTKNPVVYLALSPAATATALGIEPRKVYAAIDDGELPVFINGVKRRILVSDRDTAAKAHHQRDRATAR